MAKSKEQPQTPVISCVIAFADSDDIKRLLSGSGDLVHSDVVFCASADMNNAVERLREHGFSAKDMVLTYVDARVISTKTSVELVDREPAAE